MGTLNEMLNRINEQIDANVGNNKKQTCIWFAIRDAAFEDKRLRNFIYKRFGCDCTDITNSQAVTVYEYLCKKLA